MELLPFLDQLQTDEEKANFMKSKNMNPILLCFFTGVIYGPRPVKLIQTKNDLQEYKNTVNEYLTLEKIFEQFKGDLWTPAGNRLLERARRQQREITAGKLNLILANKTKNPLYGFSLEFKKLTTDEKINAIRLINRYLDREEKRGTITINDVDTTNEQKKNSQKLRRFIEVEKARIEGNTDFLTEEEQKRTLRGYKCACGGAYQRPKNDRHFKTAKHLLYIRRTELNQKEAKEKEISRLAKQQADRIKELEQREKDEIKREKRRIQNERYRARRHARDNKNPLPQRLKYQNNE